MKTEEKVFTYFLLSVVCFMLLLSINLRTASRKIPIAIGICTLILMIILTLMTLSSRFASWYHKMESSSSKPFTGMGNSEKDTDEKTDPSKIRKRELSIVGWLVFLTAATYIFGFLVAVPLFLLLFLKLWGKEGWVLSISVSGTVLGVIFFIFSYILQIPFHEGILF